MVTNTTPGTPAMAGLATANSLFPQPSHRQPAPSQPAPRPLATYEVTASPGADRSPVVLVADPVGVIAEALGPVLVQYVGCRVVHARSITQVHEAIDGRAPGELALVSLGLRQQAPAVISVLRGSGWPRVLALTTTGLPLASAIDAVNAGVDGVLRLPWVDHGPLHPVGMLSNRESEIIALVANGLSNKLIAEELSLSALTVKNHLARIGRKLGARDRAHIVAIAYRGGALDRSEP